MFNPDTELLFPLRVIPLLGRIRGEKWRTLISRMNSSNAKYSEKLAFVLMMARLDGCTTCNSHSFRAMRGCSLCAQQAIKRYKGSDDDLLKMYEKASSEVVKYINDHHLEYGDMLQGYRGGNIG